MIKKFLSVVVLTFLGRFLGIIQDLLIARSVGGVSIETDAFFVVLRIPKLLKSFFGETLFNPVVIPTIIQLNQTRQSNLENRIIGFLSLFFSSIIFCLVVVAYYYPGQLITIFAPGLPKDVLFIATQILFPIMIATLLIVNSELLSSVLKAYKKFVVPSLGLTIQSLTMLFFLILLFFSKIKFRMIVYAIPIGVGLELTSRFFSYLSIKQINSEDPVENTLTIFLYALKKMLPLTFGFSIVQFQLLSESIIGSFLKIGEISILHNVFRLFHLISVMLINSINTVLLPYFVESLGDELKIKKMFLAYLKLFILMASIISAFTILFSESLFTFFYAKEIYSEVVHKSVVVFKIIMSTLSLNIFNTFFANYFYAKQDTKTIAVINGISTILGIFVTGFLTYFFGLIGVVIGTSLNAFLTAIALSLLTDKYHNTSIGQTSRNFILKILLLNFTVFVSAKIGFFVVVGFCSLLLVNLYFLELQHFD